MQNKDPRPAQTNYGHFRARVQVGFTNIGVFVNRKQKRALEFI